MVKSKCRCILAVPKAPSAEHLRESFCGYGRRAEGEHEEGAE
jgi:hypothetical protein